MKRLILLVTTCYLLFAGSALAHPLGNFTINRFSRVEVRGERIYVRYVLDMAEIPAYQARQRGVDARALTRRIAKNVDLRVDGRRVGLEPAAHALAFPPGVGGLRTLRLEAALRGPRLAEEAVVAYRDRNYAGRIGWKEIVFGSETPSSSDELRAYPKDLLRSPLDVTSGTARLAPSDGPSTPPSLASGAALSSRVTVRGTGDGGFAGLIAERDLSVGFVLVSLLAAFFWGAAHAFSPGHGKAIVAAYLVGSRGTPRHALLLGLTVTLTHTIGVFALGLVTLSLSEFVLPEQLYPWLNLVSALLIVAVGISVLRWRLRDWSRRRHRHGHRHGHDHGSHGHDHEHVPASLSLRSLVGVGVSGGIIPCPTALVVLLAAIALHRVGYGLVLILAFSFGLAAAMSAIGLVAVTAKRVFSRVDLDGGIVRLLPALSALLVLGLGLAMTARALPKVG